MKFVEKINVKRCIGDLLKAGYSISVDDGEKTTLRRSTDRKAIFAAMGTTDEDWLCVHKADQPIAPGDNDTRNSFGWVRFIYGNDGWDVINDYTTNLEPVMATVNAFAEKMEGYHRSSESGHC